MEELSPINDQSQCKNPKPKRKEMSNPITHNGIVIIVYRMVFQLNENLLTKYHNILNHSQEKFSRLREIDMPSRDLM